ncbi:MAG: hypothetical protein Q4G40_04450 [Brachybacterium sp.]|nr:hypothetical protein [Brachybacterium sp.]
MQVTTDIGCGAWILARAGEFGTVGGVAGTGFARYLRILHPAPARRDDALVDVKVGQASGPPRSWSWAEVTEVTGTTMHNRVTWPEIAGGSDEARLPGGWEVGPPPEGWLDPHLLAHLTPHLASTTTTPEDLTAAIWTGWGGPDSTLYVTLGMSRAEAARAQRAHRRVVRASYDPQYLRVVRKGPWLKWPEREFVLLTTSLTELADPRWGFTAGIGWQDHPDPMPQMLWPRDESWVLASEIDWDSTVLGGSDALVEALLADARFETYEVEPGDDLSTDRR